MRACWAQRGEMNRQPLGANGRGSNARHSFLSSAGDNGRGHTSPHPSKLSSVSGYETIKFLWKSELHQLFDLTSLVNWPVSSRTVQSFSRLTQIGGISPNWYIPSSRLDKPPRVQPKVPTDRARRRADITCPTSSSSDSCPATTSDI